LHNIFFKDVQCDEWNYSTPEGKAFCQILQKKMNYKSKPEDDYRKWDIFQNYDPTTLLTLDGSSSAASISTDASAPVSSTPVSEPSKKKDLPEEDEEEVCMICLDAKPNTMVLPCEHVVVCKACSTRLPSTPDAHTCVRCRRPITHVLD
jgi:hypothetical protein